MHEGARFNQTFYPYACVLFSAGCAVRQACVADRVQRGSRHSAERGQACLFGVDRRPDRRSRASRQRSRPFAPGLARWRGARRETRLIYHGPTFSERCQLDAQDRARGHGCVLRVRGAT
ncbi:hypothetical protein XarbCFBP7604_01265 [Xanthomonas arboricola]|nr:hypothetical protein XarbCFBP7604_01265 [Xanthomonas arboricola]